MTRPGDLFYTDYTSHGLETIQEMSNFEQPTMKRVSHPLSIDPIQRSYFTPLRTPTHIQSLKTSRSSDYGATYPLLPSRQQRDDSVTPSPPPSSGNTSRHSITSSCTSSSRSRRSPAERYLSLAKTSDYSRTLPRGVVRTDEEAPLTSMSMRETQRIVNDIGKLLSHNCKQQDEKL